MREEGPTRAGGNALGPRATHRPRPCARRGVGDGTGRKSNRKVRHSKGGRAAEPGETRTNRLPGEGTAESQRRGGRGAARNGVGPSPLAFSRFGLRATAPVEPTVPNRGKPAGGSSSVPKRGQRASPRLFPGQHPRRCRVWDLPCDELQRGLRFPCEQGRHLLHAYCG